MFEVLADGALSAEPVKTFGTSFARAERYMLEHRLGGNPEMAVRWIEDQPQAPSVDEMIATLDAQPDLSDGIDPRTWREVYDEGLVDASDVTRAYGYLFAEAPKPRTGAEDQQPCPSRHPEHQAPCIAVADHLADHRDAHGCIWTNPQCQAGTAEDQGLRVTFNSGARHYQAERRCEVLAFAKWSGELLKVYLPGGTFIGIMYRSDGKIAAGETVYTYRAWTGTNPLQREPGEREVARGASMADAIQALLTAAASASRSARFEVGQRVTVVDDKYGRYIGQQGAGVEHPANLPADVQADVWVQLDDQDPRVAAAGFDADQVTKAEQFTIAGAPACGAPVDGGRCGRRPGHVGHPHIKEPGTEVRGEYYVMPHGFTAPASRPAARFPYTGLAAGDAFDQALSWAREYVKTSYDIWHADAAGSTFIVQVMADGQLAWPRR